MLCWRTTGFNGYSKGQGPAGPRLLTGRTHTLHTMHCTYCLCAVHTAYVLYISPMYKEMAVEGGFVVHTLPDSGHFGLLRRGMYTKSALQGRKRVHTAYVQYLSGMYRTCRVCAPPISQSAAPCKQSSNNKGCT